MTIPPQSITPELDRLDKLRDSVMQITDFMEWLAAKKRTVLGSWRGEELVRVRASNQTLIYEFLGLDADKIEKERRKILAGLAKKK